MQDISLAFRRVFDSPSHLFWMVAQQIGLRGLQALKFLLVARLLGPEGFGSVGVAMLALTIAEAISETGLSQAVVQSQRVINRWQAGAVWTLQSVRGLLIGAFIILLAPVFTDILRAPDAENLVVLAGVLAIFRSLHNPGFFLTYRERNFRALATYETSAIALDCFFTLWLIYNGFGAESVLLGSILAEMFKVLMTWTWLRCDVRLTFRWRLISRWTSFGKWVWGSSVIIMLLNQADKMLVARFLGVAELGLYQVASRVAQLVVADAFGALGQYLYPSFSERNRSSREGAITHLRHVSKYAVPTILLLCAGVMAFAPLILDALLGHVWEEAAPVLRVLAVASAASAVSVLFVPFFRAIGLPVVVTKAVTIQALFFIPLAIMLIGTHGALGVSIATCIGGIVIVAYFLWSIRRLV